MSLKVSDRGEAAHQCSNHDDVTSSTNAGFLAFSSISFISFVFGGVDKSALQLISLLAIEITDVNLEVGLCEQAYLAI